MKVERYVDTLHAKWDQFVRESRNGTFLLERGYMDYHRDRFPDHSVVLTDDAGGWLAVFPATVRGDTWSSHAGLTYGGLLSSTRMTTPLTLEAVASLKAYAAGLGCSRIAYKTIPHIYHRLPAEDDAYALFRHGAVLHRRDVLSVTERGNRGPVQERRRRGMKKAQKAGIVVERSTAVGPFWSVLEGTLSERHETKPVHSLAEIELLASRFPENIQLFIARRETEILAGMLMYVTQTVAHAQYIAATVEGRDAGALDLLADTLIATTFSQTRWFDFGISNEDDGRILNTGLVEQKEGFGARAVVHDHYTLNVGPT